MTEKRQRARQRLAQYFVLLLKFYGFLPPRGRLFNRDGKPREYSDSYSLMLLFEGPGFISANQYLARTGVGSRACLDSHARQSVFSAL
jgi:hypothetical protein